MTITLFHWDAQDTYTHSSEADPAAPLPLRCTLQEPPATTGTEVVVWRSNDWIVLPERPIPPEPEPQPEPVPEEVEGWQAEVAMRVTPVPTDQAENVWDRVQNLIAAMPDGPEKVTAQVALQRGKIRRDSPMLAQLAPLVPLDQEQVDDLMRLAASIQA